MLGTETGRVCLNKSSPVPRGQEVPQGIVSHCCGCNEMRDEEIRMNGSRTGLEKKKEGNF